MNVKLGKLREIINLLKIGELVFGSKVLHRVGVERALAIGGAWLRVSQIWTELGEGFGHLFGSAKVIQ